MATHRILPALVVPVLVALIIAIFAWPATRIAPHDLPIGLVGPEAATAGIAAHLQNEGFQVHPYDDEAAARDAIADREIYGVLMPSPSGLTVITASAASPVVSQLLRGAAQGMADSQGLPLSLVEAAPLPAKDPRGAAFGASFLPLIIAGFATGIVVAFTTRTAGSQWALLGITGLLTTIAAMLVVQTWLGVLAGPWLANAAVMLAFILAIATTIIGLRAWFGAAGLAAAAALFMLIGNPFSGITSAPELLPGWVSVVGQLLPPGAGASALRSTAFFDGGGLAQPLLVIVGWIVIGVGLMLTANLFRHPAAKPAPATHGDRVPHAIGA